MFGKSKTSAEPEVPAQSGVTDVPAVEDQPRLKVNPVGERAKPSVISEGFSLHGDVRSPGMLHVEGFIKGSIDSESLNIGPKGAVEGRVSCGSLHVKGSFTGTATCDELFIVSSGRVVGNITYRVLSVQRGALIEGDLIQTGVP